ncbi:MAG: alpha/beta hydrolase [Alphaproteobacteria bacterium]|nr:alpha/beta hydrolase [Alphaproteobacteria bacterium]
MRAGFVSLGGVRTRHYWAGHGPNLLLVHGVGASADTFVRNIDVLGEHFSVFALDLIGHGFTEARDMEDEVPQVAQLEHVFRFTDALGLKSYAFAGSSFGGMIGALGYFSRPSAMTHLVLIGAPVFDTPAELEKAARDAKANQTTALAAPTLETLRKRNVGSNFVKTDTFEEILLNQLTAFALPGRQRAFEQTTDGIVRWANDPRYHVHDRLEQIEVPTLVVIGRHDPRAKWERAVEGAKRMPNCRVDLFEDCGHKPFSEYASRFNRAMIEFLRA